MALCKRRTNPPQHKSYQRFKPYLREDFAYACVYCATHENEAGGPRLFSVEHYRPKSRFRHLTIAYDNLLYACTVCNGYKSDDWPSDRPVEEGRGYLDPCVYDFDEHFASEGDELIALTPVAAYMIKRLHLNRGMLRKLRRLRREAAALHEQFVTLMQRTIALLEEQLAAPGLGKRARAELSRDVEQLRTQLAQRISAWETRWEPTFTLDDYS